MMDINQTIKVSLSGRMQTLEIPWSVVMERYLMPVIGEVETKLVEHKLDAEGEWHGDFSGVCLLLIVKR